MPNWVSETEGFLEPLEIALICIVCRYTIGFSGRKEYKFNWSKIAKKLGVHRNTISKGMKHLKELDVFRFEITNGGYTMVEFNSQIPLWIDDLDKMKEEKAKRKLAEKNSRSDKKPAQTNSKPPTNKQQPPNKKVAGSGGAKYNLKEKLNKRKKSVFSFEVFEKKWLFKEKMNIELTRLAFNSLSTENKRIVLGTLEYAHNKWNKPDFNKKWIPQAQDYITKNKYLDEEIYKPYNDKLFRDKEYIFQRARYSQIWTPNAHLLMTEKHYKKYLDEFGHLKQNKDK